MRHVDILKELVNFIIIYKKLKNNMVSEYNNYSFILLKPSNSATFEPH